MAIIRFFTQGLKIQRLKILILLQMCINAYHIFSGRKSAIYNTRIEMVLKVQCIR